MTRTSARAELQVVPVPGRGPEDVLVDEQGWVLTGTEDGSVYRVQPGGRQIELVGRPEGRPLGLELLPDDRLLVCDPYVGLLAMDRATGRSENLVTHVHGRRMRCVNNAAVHSGGDVYFTDGTIEVVVESAGRTVVRHWLTGPAAGTTDLLAPDLPGYPDNIAGGSDGLIWVTIASPRDAVVEGLMRAPMPLRRLATRVPEPIRPGPKRYCRVLALDDHGRVQSPRDLDRPLRALIRPSDLQRSTPIRSSTQAQTSAS